MTAAPNWRPAPEPGNQQRVLPPLRLVRTRSDPAAQSPSEVPCGDGGAEGNTSSCDDTSTSCSSSSNGTCTSSSSSPSSNSVDASGPICNKTEQQRPTRRCLAQAAPHHRPAAEGSPSQTSPAVIAGQPGASVATFESSSKFAAAAAGRSLQDSPVLPFQRIASSLPGDRPQGGVAPSSAGRMQGPRSQQRHTLRDRYGCPAAGVPQPLQPATTVPAGELGAGLSPPAHAHSPAPACSHSARARIGRVYAAFETARKALGSPATTPNQHLTWPPQSSTGVAASEGAPAGGPALGGFGSPCSVSPPSPQGRRALAAAPAPRPVPPPPPRRTEMRSRCSPALSGRRSPVKRPGAAGHASAARPRPVPMLPLSSLTNARDLQVCAPVVESVDMPSCGLPLHILAAS